ncbi:peptide ABC transporter substrate-binding protein [Croceicoccus ponticola]|uniref:Peptide ABC transporter substrate-binding protein n=1 Tax=Croceicoccus ponticola TaxID=2217664 RepID=A0A437GUW7_9SPHN|nr:peptide ABC transporter substrate-binding protein [Croceicoccus ponticola]RVQ65332.1 peptide ABC transporter substrate-binding protein [Croceicoccus ponticola]
MTSLYSRICIALAMALSLAACSKGETDADIGVQDGILLTGNGVEPRTLDPQLNTGSPDGRIIAVLSEGLVTSDPIDPYGVLPGVAQSWEHDDEYRQWTFHLRPGAMWSDGSPLTAQDFLYSFRRILTPALGAELAELFYGIKGAEDFNKGKTDDFSTVGFSSPDPQTLVITADAPMPHLLNMLATYTFYPVQKAAVEANGKMTDRNNDWFEQGSYVGNGPFILDEWKTNQYISVKKNPNYWDAANVRLNGIRFFAIENQKSELNAYLSGQLHMTNTGSVPVERIASLRKSHPDELRTDHQPNANFYAFNTGRKAFSDKRVRKALSLALDRKLLTERVLLGGETPAGGLAPLGLPGYDAMPAPKADPAAARRLLAQAGYPGGKGFPKLDILINTLEKNRKLAEAIQAMWKKELGIDVGIYNQEWKVFLDTRKARDFDVTRSGWFGFYPGPGAYLTLMTTDSPNNDSGWSNPRYDALVAEALATGDTTKRMNLFHQAEAILIDEMPILPLYYGAQNTMVDTRVKNWGSDGAGNFKFVYLEE